MFMTRSFNVTPKTTEQHLIAHSDKSVAHVTNNKDCARRFVLLKLTTDRHEASRGLFATAELLVQNRRQQLQIISIVPDTLTETAMLFSLRVVPALMTL